MRKYPFSIYRDITSSPDNPNREYAAKNTYQESTAGRNLVIIVLVIAITTSILLATSHHKNKPDDIINISEPKLTRSVNIR